MNDGRSGYEPRRSFAPVKVGDEFDVKIEAVGAKGDGIAKKDGFVLFVPNTKEGDEVKVKVTRVLRKLGFADVVGSESSEKTEQTQEQPQEEEQPQQEESEEDTEDFGSDLDE